MIIPDCAIISKKICEQIVKEMMNDCRRTLALQHDYYKFTGTCDPMLDKMVGFVLRKGNKKK